ncbi:MAG: ferrochelatase [Alcaligenaceae bacterium]|nr:ferrochelatase [Alcaligenaceae bacterium]
MKPAIILVNLGSPDQPDASSVRKYLQEFLSDRRVVELHPAIWQVILYIFILSVRPRKVAKLYESIWLPDGAPLSVYMNRLRDKIQGLYGTDIPIEVAMRYGSNDIGSKMQALMERGYERQLIVPLYPQYSATTVATCVDEVYRFLVMQRNQPEVRFVKRYYEEAGYIDAIVHSIRCHWEQYGKPDALLMSFHGLPKRYIEQGDPYQQDCIDTAKIISEILKDEGVTLMTGYQSQFGKDEWIKPSTQTLLAQLPTQGVKHLQVICPGFSVDCLETMEEIEDEGKEIFLEYGGETFSFIPCLNDGEQWAEGLKGILDKHLAGWV